MHETKSLKDLAYNVLKKTRGEANLQRITLTPYHQNQNVTGKPEVRTDKPHDEGHLSVLSVPPEGLLDRNLENMSEVRPDKPDRLDTETNMSVLSGPSQGGLDNSSILVDFEERLAIAEYDGYQSPVQAQRIAYQDAFIAVLNTLPHEKDKGYYDEDWLTRRVKAAQSWLVAQGLQQPK